jgi:hypothetical protein
MSLRRVFVAAAISLLSIAAIAGAGFVWLKVAPRRTPAGQPALSRLDAAALPAFREAFNARADETRIVVLLSPT